MKTLKSYYTWIISLVCRITPCLVMHPNPIALQSFANAALSLQIRKCHPICPINLPEQFNLWHLLFKSILGLLLAFRWHVLSFTQKSCVTSISSDKNDKGNIKMSLKKKYKSADLDYKSWMDLHWAQLPII